MIAPPLKIIREKFQPWILIRWWDMPCRLHQRVSGQEWGEGWFFFSFSKTTYPNLSSCQISNQTDYFQFWRFFWPPSMIGGLRTTPTLPWKSCKIYPSLHRIFKMAAAPPLILDLNMNFNGWYLKTEVQFYSISSAKYLLCTSLLKILSIVPQTEVQIVRYKCLLCCTIFKFSNDVMVHSC